MQRIEPVHATSPDQANAGAGEELPYRNYRRIHLPKPAELHTGLDGLVHSWIGRYRRRLPVYRRLSQDAQRIHAAADSLRDQDLDSLRARVEQHREAFRRRPDNRAREAALGTLIELAGRTVGLRPRPVQVMGALGLEQGFLVEMATGEGKSLTVALAATLAAWRNRTCHVLTVNDYLAARDVEEFAPYFDLCRVSVAAVGATMEDDERRHGYQHDAVYTTAKQLLADFLKDRLRIGAIGEPERVQLQDLAGKGVGRDQLLLRGLDSVIVDEADSVLIDEAVSPLIISQPRPNPELGCAIKSVCALSLHFKRDTHFRCDERFRSIELTPVGEALWTDLAEDLPGMWKAVSRREELLVQALQARELYHRDRQYVIRDDQVVIVDEFTGRLAEQRSWSHGLHQAIEAKEGVAVTDPNETLLRLSFQRFIRLFRQVSGLTGTGTEVANEFWRIYRLPVLPVPLHQPCIREIWQTSTHPDKESKWEAVVQEVAAVSDNGRPVLVGTRSVQESEHLAALLDDRGVHYRLINAVNAENEAQVVASAGQAGVVTIATNMAGRGTDIKLSPQAHKNGGLHVIVSEPHESRRIDRQLMGRASRQGDPGSARTFVSRDDELFLRFAGLSDRLLLRTQGLPLSAPFVHRALVRCQGVAERLAYSQRRSVLRTDTWLEQALTFGDPSKGSGI